MVAHNNLPCCEDYEPHSVGEEGGGHGEEGERRKEKGEPTPNRVQSSLLELPRCEGGKDCEAGLKERPSGLVTLKPHNLTIYIGVRSQRMPIFFVYQLCLFFDRICLYKKVENKFAL